MRRLANAYILLFLIDSGLSLCDEILASYEIRHMLLANARLLVAYAVIGLSSVIFVCLGIDRRLPKILFLPMTLYIFWCSLSMWPLSGVVERELLPLISAVGQVALMAMIFLVRGGQVLLPLECFEQERFRLAHTLGFVGVNLLLAPIIMIYTSLAIASQVLEQQTAGFLRIGPLGIYMAERNYSHDAKNIRLAGMMHIGKEDYYNDLERSLSTEQAIILTEGVTDQDRLLTRTFNYSRLAEVFGLSTQNNMQIEGTLVTLDNFDRRYGDHGGNPHITRADIDIKNFDPFTIGFLNTLGEMLFSGEPFFRSYGKYNAWINENMTPERLDIVMADLLDKRNDVVIESMSKALSHYDTIIIPWGAMHMPAIETAVYDKGFELVEEKERMSLDFRALPYRQLWQKISFAVKSQ